MKRIGIVDEKKKTDIFVVTVCAILVKLFQSDVPFLINITSLVNVDTTRSTYDYACDRRDSSS